MKIKQVSKLTGLTEKTIHYYESKGFITPDMHDINGRCFRDYDDTHILMLKSVSILRKARFSIEQISVMHAKPEQIKEITCSYITGIDDALCLLESIKEQLKIRIYVLLTVFTTLLPALSQQLRTRSFHLLI